MLSGIWRVLPIFLSAGLVVPRQSPAPSSPSDLDSVITEANVHYLSVSGSELHLEVYEPANRGSETSPAILLIHGGAWSSLDKSTMRGMGQFLARSGFVAFAIDYRLFQNNENRWPAQLDDVQCAVRWVRPTRPNTA